MVVFLLYLFDHNYITQLFSWEVEVGSNFVFQHGFDFFLPLIVVQKHGCYSCSLLSFEIAVICLVVVVFFAVNCNDAMSHIEL